MTIELTILISVLSVSAALFFGLKNNKRANDAEVERTATNMTSVIVKLEHISTGVTEIKSELGNVKQDLKDVTEKVIIAEQIAKSAQKRLDEHIGKSAGKGD